MSVSWMGVRRDTGIGKACEGLMDMHMVME